MLTSQKINMQKNRKMSKCQNVRIAKLQKIRKWNLQIWKYENVKIPKRQNAAISECQDWGNVKNASNFESSDFGNTTTHTNNEFEKGAQLLKQRLAAKEWNLHQHNSFADCSSYSARPHLDFEPDLPAKRTHIGDQKFDVISGTTFGTALREFESRSPSIICLIFHGVGGEGVNSH